MEKKEWQVEGDGMITKEELRGYAKLTGLNLGQAEKDYFQNIILFVLYRAYGTELVFKGGTALKKCYGIDRFSEDLDFTCERRIDEKRLYEGLSRFKLDFEGEVNRYKDGLKIVLRIKGPLYIGERKSLCRFVIDLSFRENVIVRPSVKTIGRFMEETPQFDVFVMDEREILAEKVRAVMTRSKARDVYDLRFLLEKGVEFDEGLVRRKLEYYGEAWSPKEFAESLRLKEEVWETELGPLVGRVPDFKETRRILLKGLGRPT